MTHPPSIPSIVASSCKLVVRQVRPINLTSDAVAETWMERLMLSFESTSGAKFSMTISTEQREVDAKELSQLVGWAHEIVLKFPPDQPIMSDADVILFASQLGHQVLGSNN